MSALLLGAILRLTPIALEAYREPLALGHWGLAGAFTLFMLYSEGYRGFQQRFSPRTAARIRYLRDRPDAVRSLLAPLFAMGFFHATRRTKIVAYGLTLGILFLVLVVQRVPQPWRGIVDTGVVLGLSWGVISFAGSTARALTRADFDASPETPADPASRSVA